MYVANNKAPIAPTDAASVGVAKPDKIEPKTDIIKKRGGKRIRNAVIGKVHRLGLAGRASPTRPKSRIRHREPSNFSSNFSSKDRLNDNLKPLSLPEPAVSSDGSPINILMLTEKICKWPIGEPSDEDFRFCGLNRIQGSVYCEEHTKVAYQPLETRRKKKEYNF